MLSSHNLKKGGGIGGLHKELQRQSQRQTRRVREVSKSFVAKKWKEKNWSPLPFKVGNDLFVRSIFGETRSDLKRDQMCTHIQHWADYHQKWKKEIFSGTIRMLPMSPYYIYLHFEWTHICHMGQFRTQAFEHCYDGYWWERELPYLRNRLNSQLRTGGQGGHTIQCGRIQ